MATSAIEQHVIEQETRKDLIRLYLHQFRTGTDCFIAILHLMGWNCRELAEHEFGVGRSAIHMRIKNGRERFVAAARELVINDGL